MAKISKNLLLLLLLLFALSPPLFAQRFKGAVMGGMNISQVDGDEVYGYHRVGGQIGLAAILPLKKWDITLETVFNQKGAVEKQQYENWEYNYDTNSMLIDSTLYTGAYNLRLNYVEVPLMVHYTDRDRYTVGIGFSYGRLVNYSEIEHGGNVPPYSDTVAFKKNDYCVVADLQIRVWRQLKFNIRFSYSMAPIRERTYYDVIYHLKEPWTRKQYNNMLTFRLVYVFNEKVPEKEKKE
jgi:hypothetical protein